MTMKSFDQLSTSIAVDVEEHTDEAVVVEPVVEAMPEESVVEQQNTEEAAPVVEDKQPADLDEDGGFEFHQDAENVQDDAPKPIIVGEAVPVEKKSEPVDDGFKVNTVPNIKAMAPDNSPQFKVAHAIAEGLEVNGFNNPIIAKFKNNIMIVCEADGKCVTISGIGTHLINDGRTTAEVIGALKESAYKERINLTSRVIAARMKKIMAKLDYVMQQKQKSAITRQVSSWCLQNPGVYDSYITGMEIYLKGFTEFVPTGLHDGLVGVHDNNGKKDIWYRVSIKDILYDQGILPYKNHPMLVSENTPRNSYKPLSIIGHGDPMAALVAFKLLNVCGNPHLVAYEAQAAKSATKEKLDELRGFFK